MNPVMNTVTSTVTSSVTEPRAPGWLSFLRPFTTPLEPATWLRTWLPHATSSTERVSRSEGTADEGPLSVTWNSRRFETEPGEEESILELLERNGESPTFGCRRGICRRCTVTLESGVVRDLRDGYDTSAAPGTHVRICVSSPLTHAEIVGSEDGGCRPELREEVAS